jgi:Transglutaminase-like superfamily
MHFCGSSKSKVSLRHSYHGAGLVDIRAAAWTALALRDVRRQLRKGIVQGVSARPSPPLPAEAVRGVEALLRRKRHTCLERALVLQRWYADHDDARDVVIAGRGTADVFEAHAWVEGDPDPLVGQFREMLRLTAPKS